ELTMSKKERNRMAIAIKCKEHQLTTEENAKLPFITKTLYIFYYQVPYGDPNVVRLRQKTFIAPFQGLWIFILFCSMGCCPSLIYFALSGLIQP
ncbi:MAG: hypothetical protein WCJ01_10145, partial [Ignavibacteria bacterium]